ncbi:hypothetical protein DsansV1_C05g0053291 [Dioscorea sansibarensis]
MMQRKWLLVKHTLPTLASVPYIEKDQRSLLLLGILQLCQLLQPSIHRCDPN